MSNNAFTTLSDLHCFYDGPIPELDRNRAVANGCGLTPNGLLAEYESATCRAAASMERASVFIDLKRRGRLPELECDHKIAGAWSEYDRAILDAQRAKESLFRGLRVR